MSFWQKPNKILSSFVMLSVISVLTPGCYDQEHYQKLYAQYCAEGKQLDLSKPIDLSAMCNREPLLLAMAKMPKAEYADDLDNIVSYLVSRQFDPNVKEIVTGRTPLIMAIDSKNLSFAKAIFGYSLLSAKDLNGNTYMHHVAAANLPGSDLLFDSATAQIANTAGELPVETAYRAQNFSYVWSIIIAENRNDLLAKPRSDLRANILFSPKLESRPELVEMFAPLLNVPDSGGYRLIHFASENALPNLASYLVKRRVEANVMSSRGSPLALAADAYVKAVDSGGRFRAEKTINSLFELSGAVAMPDVLNELAHTMNMSWVQRALDYDIEMSPGNSLFANCNASSNGSVPNMTLIYNIYFCRKVFVNWQILGHERNAARQNEAHFALFLLSDNDVEMQFKSFFSTGFTNLISSLQKYDLLNQTDVFGMLPLHYWFLNKSRSNLRGDLQVEHLNAILKNTNDPAAITYNGDSVLGFAVNTRDLNLVKAVLSEISNANSLIRRRNKQGLSPLTMADKNGDRKIYEYLKTHF